MVGTLSPGCCDFSPPIQRPEQAQPPEKPAMSAFISTPSLCVRARAPLPTTAARPHAAPLYMSSPPMSRRAFTLAALSTLTVPFLPAGAQQVSAPSLAPPARVTQAEALRKAVKAVIAKDPSMAATLLRLSFHDSFTFDLDSGRGGANGSIRMETGRGENFGLQRAVDALKPIQEQTGLGWGDAVALAGAVAVEATGGPKIDIKLGRDQAEVPDPTGILPSPADTVEDLRKSFVPRGFDDRDIVALSGAHTLGRAGGGGPFVAQSNTFQNEYV